MKTGWKALSADVKIGLETPWHGENWFEDPLGRCENWFEECIGITRHI
jgi:hypothetical protein